MSALVDSLRLQIRAAKLPAPKMEYRFAPPRRWRFDLCWPSEMLAVEVEGGVWTRGRHSRGAGMIADATKYNEAVIRGWRILRFMNTHIADGSALKTIEMAMSASRVDNHPIE